MKKEYPWLKEVDSLTLASVQMNLEGVFRKFFQEPGVGFPRYKSKKVRYLSRCEKGSRNYQKQEAPSSKSVRFKWWEHVTDIRTGKIEEIMLIKCSENLENFKKCME